MAFSLKFGSIILLPGDNLTRLPTPHCNLHGRQKLEIAESIVLWAKQATDHMTICPKKKSSLKQVIQVGSDLYVLKVKRDSEKTLR